MKLPSLIFRIRSQESDMWEGDVRVEGDEYSRAEVFGCKSPREAFDDLMLWLALEACNTPPLKFEQGEPKS